MSRFYQTAEERIIFWHTRGYEWGYLNMECSGFDAFDNATSYPQALARALQEENDPALARELFIDGFDLALAERRSRTEFDNHNGKWEGSYQDASLTR